MLAQAGDGVAHGDLDAGAMAAHGLHHLPALCSRDDVAGQRKKPPGWQKRTRRWPGNARDTLESMP